VSGGEDSDGNEEEDEEDEGESEGESRLGSDDDETGQCAVPA